MEALHRRLSPMDVLNMVFGVNLENYGYPPYGRQPARLSG